MNDHEKSDSSVIPLKPSNKSDARGTEAETVEGRGLAKGNPGGADMPRTQSRIHGMPSGLERIREAARRDRKQRFTALFQHVHEPERLKAAYRATRRQAAAGVDRVTWETYAKNLDENIRELSERLERGAYRAKPVRRVYIAKADGSQRPLGIPTLEDKIVQRAMAEVLGAIYEQDFIGFSYGFRPGRSPHQALDALSAAITMRKVGWVLDADIRGFYDTINHEWLLKFVEHRIGDERVIRLIRKWLKAGVLEDGELVEQEEGAVQGGSISPLLANIYLHYVFDLWAQRWRKDMTGDVVVVRFADDLVVGFTYQADGKRFLRELGERFAKFGLGLHPEKTRLLEFGRFAAANRQRRGQGKPETFDFLGFTHMCGETRAGKFMVRRKTARKRLQAKLKAMKIALRRRLHWSVPKMGKYLGTIVRGHVQYFGVPLNSSAIDTFRYQVGRLWKRALERRSERTYVTWARIQRLMKRWLPPAHICHPYPIQRFLVTTQGRSPVR